MQINQQNNMENKNQEDKHEYIDLFRDTTNVILKNFNDKNELFNNYSDLIDIKYHFNSMMKCKNKKYKLKTYMDKNNSTGEIYFEIILNDKILKLKLADKINMIKHSKILEKKQVDKQEEKIPEYILGKQQNILKNHEQNIIIKQQEDIYSGLRFLFFLMGVFFSIFIAFIVIHVGKINISLK